MTKYQPEDLGYYDDGTMPNNVKELKEAVVGHRIVAAEQDGDDFFITLDNGKRVILQDTSECCAYTYLDGFLLHPELVDHVITGVGTTGGYTTWHIYADLGDVLQLNVHWSEGSGYYGYGFYLTVTDAPEGTKG